MTLHALEPKAADAAHNHPKVRIKADTETMATEHRALVTQYLQDKSIAEATARASVTFESDEYFARQVDHIQLNVAHLIVSILGTMISMCRNGTSKNRLHAIRTSITTLIDAEVHKADVGRVRYCPLAIHYQTKFIGVIALAIFAEYFRQPLAIAAYDFLAAQTESTRLLPKEPIIGLAGSMVKSSADLATQNKTTDMTYHPAGSQALLVDLFMARYGQYLSKLSGGSSAEHDAHDELEKKLACTLRLADGTNCEPNILEKMAIEYWQRQQSAGMPIPAGAQDILLGFNGSLDRMNDVFATLNKKASEGLIPTSNATPGERINPNIHKIACVAREGSYPSGHNRQGGVDHDRRRGGSPRGRSRPGNKDKERFVPDPRTPAKACSSRWGQGDGAVSKEKSDSARAKVARMDLATLKKVANKFYPSDMFNTGAPKSEWWTIFPPVDVDTVHSQDIGNTIRDTATPIEYWATRRIRECAPGLRRESTRNNWPSKSPVTNQSRKAFKAVQSPKSKGKKGAGNAVNFDTEDKRLIKNISDMYIKNVNDMFHALRRRSDNEDPHDDQFQDGDGSDNGDSTGLGH